MALALRHGIGDHADRAKRIDVDVAEATAPSFWPARSRSMPVFNVEM